ncbi:MAG: hypothetical protein BTN85_1966 [Candidatus Methanohalarchaeum thermophilum]|uniref:Uncharacterized protein n=1 Tax=Methanohalarchaeum thermophilum TaxID=1903181 RepID=A0A1Q6DSG8_METT1|nr:MAG: hypothetical protein BTN85_1966 [Candidatus Methanohalarchaeum thermophilum]
MGDDSILAAAILMVVISVVLFWLPILGPFIAGIIGGKKAGGPIAGIIAALLPAIALGVLLFLFGSILTGLPFIGAIIGGSTFLLVISTDLILILGAIIGGILD